MTKKLKYNYTYLREQIFFIKENKLFYKESSKPSSEGPSIPVCVDQERFIEGKYYTCTNQGRFFGVYYGPQRNGELVVSCIDQPSKDRPRYSLTTKLIDSKVINQSFCEYKYTSANGMHRIDKMNILFFTRELYKALQEVYKPENIDSKEVYKISP